MGILMADEEEETICLGQKVVAAEIDCSYFFPC